MAEIEFKGKPVHTNGELPDVGSIVPSWVLVRGDLSEVALSDFPGEKLLNIFPSLDTGVCAASVRHFAGHAGDLLVLDISKDLPFAQARFCRAEGLGDTVTLSAFRSSFALDYGVELVDGPLKGLCARAILRLDRDNRVIYRELVPEITQEPNYDAALRR